MSVDVRDRCAQIQTPSSGSGLKPSEIALDSRDVRLKTKMRTILVTLSALVLGSLSLLHAIEPISTSFQVRLLHGQSGFVFTMYGAPGSWNR